MAEMSRIAALILAAGSSSRMGSFKPLLPLGRSTCIEEAIARFRRAGIADVRVVIGHRSEELKPVLERIGVRWVFNPEHEKGMFSSVLAGVRSFESSVEAFFLLPADIPLVSPRTVRALLEACEAHGPGIVYPRFEGKRGHPPLIPASFLEGELPADVPGGLRAVLARHEEAAVDVDVIDEAVLLDCDTPEDYRSLERRWAAEGIPSEKECEAIWSRLGVSEEIRAHSRLVAELARILAVLLNGAGLNLDLPLIVAAGLLHDIARRERDHARAGADLLVRMGYPRVGVLVARHMDIHPANASPGEAELIYFADKCVEGDRLVSLEDRFERSMSRHAGQPDVLKKIRKRRQDAESIGSRIAAAIGSPVEDVVRHHGRSIRAAALSGRRTIFLVRHGAIQSPHDPKRFIGQLDLPLTEFGRVQADLLREALREAPLSAVYCSDLARAMDTAETIARPHGLGCIARRDLREISLGSWEGRTFEEVRRDFALEFLERGRDMLHYRTPGGESFLECSFRVMGALYDILHSTRGDILIVGHAGVNRILLSQALGRSLDDLFGIDQDYGCLNVISYRSQTFDVKLLNGSPGTSGSFQSSASPDRPDRRHQGRPAACPFLQCS